MPCNNGDFPPRSNNGPEIVRDHARLINGLAISVLTAASRKHIKKSRE